MDGIHATSDIMISLTGARVQPEVRGAEQGGDRRAGRAVAAAARQLRGGAQAQRLPEVHRDGGAGQEQGGQPGMNE